MDRTNLALSLVLMFATFALSTPQARQSEPTTGKLIVTVMDTMGRLVANVPVTIEGKGIRRGFVSADKENEFDLPSGVYGITSGKGQGYYYNFRRSEFFLEAGMTLHISVILAIRITAIGSGISEDASSVDLTPKPRYETFRVPDSRKPEIELMVQYDRKRKLGKTTAYQGGERPFSGVVVTYDALTILADAITIDRETLRIEARGNVIIEDGRRRERTQGKVVEFKAGKAVIRN